MDLSPFQTSLRHTSEDWIIQKMLPRFSMNDATLFFWDYETSTIWTWTVLCHMPLGIRGQTPNHFIYKHPIILFTSTDTALWDSTKYRNENKISSTSKMGNLTHLHFAHWQVVVPEFLYCQWGSDCLRSCLVVSK